MLSEKLRKIDGLLRFLARTMAIALLVVAVFTYIYFCPPVLTRTNGGFILFPMPPGAEYACQSVNNVKREELWFKTADGSKLNAWFFKSPEAGAPVILFSHGNAGNIGHRLLIAKHLMDAGASVFLFDYREFGKSQGKKGLHACVEDSRAAYDYLTKERLFSPEDIVLYGESIGGGPTCELARTVPVKAVILDSSFTGLLQVGKKKVSFFQIYPDFLQPSPAFNNIEYLKGVHPPVLIIHGRKDEVIPVSEAEENYAAASEPKSLLILPDSTHNWKEPDFSAYTKGVGKFLQEIRHSSGN